MLYQKSMFSIGGWIKVIKTCLTEKNKFDDGDQTVKVEVSESFDELAFAEHMFSFFKTKTLCNLETFS